MPAGLAVGRLREKVTIQSLTTVRDAHGQPIETWGTFAAWRCEIAPIRGREFFAARQFQAETTHKLTGHWISGVLPTMRISHGSRIFRIEAVINVGERNRVLELMCAETLGG